MKVDQFTRLFSYDQTLLDCYIGWDRLPWIWSCTSAYAHKAGWRPCRWHPWYWMGCCWITFSVHGELVLPKVIGLIWCLLYSRPLCFFFWYCKITDLPSLFVLKRGRLVYSCEKQWMDSGQCHTRPHVAGDNFSWLTWHAIKYVSEQSMEEEWSIHHDQHHMGCLGGVLTGRRHPTWV